MNKPVVFVIASFSVVLLLVAAFAESPFICAVSAFAAMIFAALTAVCYCVLPNERNYYVMLWTLVDNDPRFSPFPEDGIELIAPDELEEVFLETLEAE